MKTKVILLSLAVLVFASCSKDKINENINKTGDVAGQVVGEFASGVGSGVEKAITPKITLSDALQKQNISLGKSIIGNDSSGKVDNVLSQYFIFNTDYKGVFTAKVFNNKGLEMGRSKATVKAKKDDAFYIDFVFDKRTDIDNDSRITIE
ncbi:MAG: hypothetical protein LBR81_04860 [Prevotellaceae bacterium]|jgi:hypothetical protein|nr:hypothetical protein [Prevotellaceae bacterium]